MKLLNAAASVSFIFQPIVLSKLLALMLYYHALHAGLRTWQMARNTQMTENEKLRMQRVSQLVEKGHAWIFAPFFILAMAVFFFSGAIAFAIAYIPVMLSIALVWWLASGLLQGISRCFESIVTRLTVPNPGFIRALALQPLSQVHDMLWFLDASPFPSKRFVDFLGLIYVYDYIKYKRKGLDSPREEVKLFQTLTLRVSVPMMIASSFVALGSLHMANTYAGRPGDMLSFCYETAFRCLLTAQFVVPDLGWIDFNLDALLNLGQYIATLMNFRGYPPELMIEGARALTALNFFISCVRPMTAYANRALSALSNYMLVRSKVDKTGKRNEAKNIQFHEIAAVCAPNPSPSWTTLDALAFYPCSLISSLSCSHTGRTRMRVQRPSVQRKLSRQQIRLTSRFAMESRRLRMNARPRLPRQMLRASPST
jgi:hypothetical protein